MRLPRPYIPLAVQVQVAENQLREKDPHSWLLSPLKPLSHKLDLLLHALFDEQKVELHHRPALCNREVIWDGVCWPDMKYVLTFKSALATDARYVPDANDPDYLIWLPKADHDIETRVRGQHGQHSDLALARKRKRTAKKRALSEGVLQARGKSLFPVRRMQSVGKVTASSVKGRTWTLKANLKRKFKWPKRKLQSCPFSSSRKRRAASPQRSS